MTYGVYDGNGSLLAAFAAPLTMRSNRPTFSSDSLSLKRNTRRRAAHRWELQTNLEPLTYSANDLFVELVTKGNSETVIIRVPQNFGVIHKRTSVSTPTGFGTAGSSTVTVTGNSGRIPKGCFIRFSNHSKIYMTATELNNNGTLGVYPPLRVTVNNTFAHRDDVDMPCLIDTDTVIGMVYTDGIMMDMGSLKFIERL